MAPKASLSLNPFPLPTPASVQETPFPPDDTCKNSPVVGQHFWFTGFAPFPDWCDNPSLSSGRILEIELTRTLVQSAPSSNNDGLNPYPNKPRVVFRDDGTFKITVFSDLHFGENPWDWWGPEQDSNSTRVMKRVLKDETPDYVYVVSAELQAITNLDNSVINGDLITGESGYFC